MLSLRDLFNNTKLNHNLTRFMKKLISVVAACFVLCSCNNSQKADEPENVVLEQEDTILLQENKELVFDNFIISGKVITHIKGLEHIDFGVPLSVIKKKYSNYIFKEHPDGFGDILSDKNKTFELLLSGDDTIRSISFWDTNFKLNNGLMVGSPISKIKKIYPQEPIYYNNGEGELFIIDNVNLRIFITVESNDGKLLGEYKMDEYGNIEIKDEESFKYRTNGKIINIHIKLIKQYE